MDSAIGCVSKYSLKIGNGYFSQDILLRSRRVVSEGSFMTSLLIDRSQKFSPYGILTFSVFPAYSRISHPDLHREVASIIYDLAPVTSFTLGPARQGLQVPPAPIA